MSRGADPEAVFARILIEAGRLARWAKASGSPEQLKVAVNFNTLCEHLHANKTFIPPADLTAANPEGNEVT